MENKIISHNPKFKENLAKAIAYLYKSDEIADYLKIGYINMAPWATEKSDDNSKIKYIGQPYWTKKAIESFKKNGINGLRHEHVVPNKIIREKLKESKKEFASIYEILDKVVLAVIVTKEEAYELDKYFKVEMPKHIEFRLSNEVDYLLSRYIEFNKLNEFNKIEIYYLNDNQRKTSKTIKEIDLKMIKKIL